MSELNKVYPVLPLRNTVLFPNQIIPIYIGREQSLKLVSDVSKLDDKTISKIAKSLQPRPYSSREFIAEMGKWLVKNSKKRDL